MNRGTKAKQPTNEPYFSFENFMFSNLTRVSTEEKECQICKRITTIAYLYKDITYYSHYECLSLYFLYRFFSITKSAHFSLNSTNNATSETRTDNTSLNNETDSGDEDNFPNQRSECNVGVSGHDTISMDLDSVDSTSVDAIGNNDPKNSTGVEITANNHTTTSTNSISNSQFISLYDIYKGSIQDPLDYDFYGNDVLEDRPIVNKRRRCYSCGIVDPHFKCFVQECNNYMHVNCSGNGHMIVYTNPLVNLNVYTSLRNKPMNVIAPIIINSTVNQVGDPGPSEQELVIDNYLKFNIIHVKEKFISYRFMLCYKHIHETIINSIKLLFLYRFMVIKEYQYVHTIISVIATYNASIAKSKEDKKNRTVYRPGQVNGMTSLTATTPSSSMDILVDNKLQQESMTAKREAKKQHQILPKKEVGGIKTEFKRDVMLLRNRSEMGRGDYDLMEEREDRKNALMINNLMCEYNLYKKSNLQKNNKPFNPANFNILFQPTTLSINIDTAGNLSGSLDVNLVNIRDDEVLENDIRLLLNLSGQISSIYELKKMTIQNEFNIQNVAQVIRQLLYSPKHTESSALTHLKSINSRNRVSREDEDVDEYERVELTSESLTEKDVYRSVMKRPRFALLKLYNKYVWVCITKLESGCRRQEESVDSRMVLLEYVPLSTMEYIYMKNIVNSMYYQNNSVMLLMHSGSRTNCLRGGAEGAGQQSSSESSGEAAAQSSAVATTQGDFGKAEVINLCGYSWDMNPPLYKFYKVHHLNTHSPTKMGLVHATSVQFKGDESSAGVGTLGVNVASKGSESGEADAYQNSFVYKQSIAILSALKSINSNIESYKRNIENNIAKDSVKYNNLFFDTAYVNFYKNVSTALHRYNHFKQAIRRSILHYNPVDSSSATDDMKNDEVNDATSNADKSYSDNTNADGKYMVGKTTESNYGTSNMREGRRYNGNSGLEDEKYDVNSSRGYGNGSDNNGMEESGYGRKNSVGGRMGVCRTASNVSRGGSVVKGGMDVGGIVTGGSMIRSIGNVGGRADIGGISRGSSLSNIGGIMGGNIDGNSSSNISGTTSSSSSSSSVTNGNKAADENNRYCGRNVSNTKATSERGSISRSGSITKREDDVCHVSSVSAGGTAQNKYHVTNVTGNAVSSSESDKYATGGTSSASNTNNAGDEKKNTPSVSTRIRRTSSIKRGRRHSVKTSGKKHGTVSSKGGGAAGSKKYSPKKVGAADNKGDDETSNNEEEDNYQAEINDIANESGLGEGYGGYKTSMGTGEGADNAREKVKITKEYCSVCLLSELSHKHILIQCQKCYLRIHYKCYYNYRLSNLLNNTASSPAPKDKEAKTGFYCDPCSKEYNQRYETNYNSAICISCLSSGGAMKAIYVPSSATSHTASYQMYRSSYSGEGVTHGTGGASQQVRYPGDSKMNEVNGQAYRGAGYGASGISGSASYPGGMYASMNMRSKNARTEKKAGEDEKWIHLICLVFLMPKVVCYDFINLNQWYIPNRIESMSTCSICGVVGGIQVKCTYTAKSENTNKAYKPVNVTKSSQCNGTNGTLSSMSKQQVNMMNGTDDTMNDCRSGLGTVNQHNKMVNGYDGPNRINGPDKANGVNGTPTITNNQHNHVTNGINGTDQGGSGDGKINGKCDCELTFHPMCCLLSGCYIRYSNKNNLNLKQYQLHTFMNNFFNEVMQSEGHEAQNNFNSTSYSGTQSNYSSPNNNGNVGTRRNLEGVLNNLFQSIILEPLCLKHTVELYTEKFVREQTVNRCYAYTHYLYHPDGFKNKKKYNSLPIEPIYSPVTITKNGPVKSQPRILPQHYDSNFPVGVVTKRAKYNEPYLISVVYGLPKTLCGDVPKYGITAITNYLSNSQKSKNQHNSNQAATSQHNNVYGREREMKSMCDDKLWFSRLQHQYMMNK